MPDNVTATSANATQTRAQQLLAFVESKQGIEKLIAIMQSLRDPQGGCPWDKQQNYQSITPFTIEEVYEVVEAIELNDFDSLKDELGDLLFQVVFYAQLGKEQGRFDFDAVVEAISNKLIRRHPHVFADAEYANEATLNQAWEESKHQERLLKSAKASSLVDDIPKALPELKRAQKIQKRVAKVGFDWKDVARVWDKVEEEKAEVLEAFDSGDKAHLEEELGDFLFVAVNLCRHYGVDAETALRKANQKFASRFQLVENFAQAPLDKMSLEQLEQLWLKAKIAHSNE